MIVHGRRRGGRGGRGTIPLPEPDPFLEAIKEAQAKEGYLNLFLKSVKLIGR